MSKLYEAEATYGGDWYAKHADKQLVNEEAGSTDAQRQRRLEDFIGGSESEREEQDIYQRYR